MFYRAKIFKDGTGWGVEFPDCPGCLTCADSRDEALSAAKEALEGWLETHLQLRRLAPKPTAKKGQPVYINDKLAVGLQIRWARDEQGLTQSALAQKAGLTQQQVAKLESPDGNPTLASVSAAAGALGLRLELVA